MCIIFKDKYSCLDYRMYIIDTFTHPYPCDKCRLNKNKKK